MVAPHMIACSPAIPASKIHENPPRSACACGHAVRRGARPGLSRQVRAHRGSLRRRRQCGYFRPDPRPEARRRAEAAVRRREPRRRSEEHTSELQSRPHLVCRLLLEKKNRNTKHTQSEKKKKKKKKQT